MKAIILLLVTIFSFSGVFAQTSAWTSVAPVGIDSETAYGFGGQTIATDGTKVYV